MGNHHFFQEKLTSSLAMYKSYVTNYQKNNGSVKYARNHATLPSNKHGFPENLPLNQIWQCCSHILNCV